MTKAPIKLQDLRRRLYVKAKAEPTWRFWGLYVHVCKRETLWEAYQLAKQNNGAPGVDGVTFQAIEAEGGATEPLRDPAPVPDPTHIDPLGRFPIAHEQQATLISNFAPSEDLEPAKFL